MKNRILIDNLFAAAIALGAVGLALAPALAEDGALPPTREMGGVSYLSGGIGSDETQAIQSAARQWPLTLEFAVHSTPRAEYAADVQVRIVDADGHTVLDTRADGPFLLVKLQPGRYTVNAARDGKTLTRAVDVQANRPMRQLFEWVG